LKIALHPLCIRCIKPGRNGYCRPFAHGTRYPPRQFFFHGAERRLARLQGAGQILLGVRGADKPDTRNPLTPATDLK
jgi:hypothetical protein